MRFELTHTQTHTLLYTLAKSSSKREGDNRSPIREHGARASAPSPSLAADQDGDEQRGGDGQEAGVEQQRRPVGLLARGLRPAEATAWRLDGQATDRTAEKPEQPNVVQEQVVRRVFGWEIIT